MPRPITASIRIAAPPDRVFALFTDLRNAPGRVKGITALEVLTDGSIRKGTRFRETRTMFGRSCTETMEITGFDAPRSYTVACNSGGCTCQTRFDFRPDSAGTAVEFTFTASAQTFFAKLMSPLFRLMASTCRKAVERDMADLKAAAESDAPAAAAVSA